MLAGQAESSLWRNKDSKSCLLIKEEMLGMGLGLGLGSRAATLGEPSREADQIISMGQQNKKKKELENAIIVMRWIEN